jgi:two-component system, OmpR family, phosphate regulon sensor histidine kinase PhoR
VPQPALHDGAPRDLVPRPAPRAPRWRGPSWTPARIVAVYGLVSVLWIAFSDRMLAVLVADPVARERAQTAKGALFVVVTGALLFALMRRSESGLKSLGNELRATLDSMADGVLVVDSRSCVVEANQAALELLAVRSKDEVLGPMEGFVQRFAPRHPDGAPLALDRTGTMRALSGERVAAYDAILRRADGQDVHVSISAAPVRGARGPGLAVAVLRDVSFARRLDDMREEFLSTAAHELKTPLAVIKAYAQLMQKRDSGTPALAVIVRQVDRLSRLVQHLLDTSRLRIDGAGVPEAFDLRDVVDGVVTRTGATAPDHALSVRADGPAPVVGDRERIERAVTSLLENAIRFSPDGGPVETRISTVDREIVVSVADRGVGIAPERQARVFERYYRAHAGTPEDYGGLGIGLDVSRDIVARHGGRMWFESTPGAGSTFHFSLPRAPEGT